MAAWSHCDEGRLVGYGEKSLEVARSNSCIGPGER